MKAVKIENGEIVIQADDGEIRNIPFLYKEPTLEQVNDVIEYYVKSDRSNFDNAIANSYMLSGVVQSEKNEGDLNGKRC